MIRVILYSRAGCHLCEQTREDLESLQDDYPHQLVEIDIDKNEALQKAYFDKIPVVEVGPYRMSAPISKADLKIRLAAALDKERHRQKIDEKQGKSTAQEKPMWSRSDQLALWFSQHYMAVLNTLVLLYFGLPFLAPVLMKVQWQAPARAIYWLYGNTCHQLSYRSWFLFGKQPIYPRASARLDGYLTYGQVTNLPEDDNNEALLAARNFVGTEEIGYKVALCQRDVAIYGAIFLFGIIFSLTGRKIPGLPLWLWILIGILPVGIDGFSQLLSQPPFGLFPYRETTPLLRTITGALFGLTTAWFGYPVLEESMAETRKTMELRLAKAVSAITRKW